MRSKYFFGFIISFIVGVGLESLLHFGIPFALLFLLLGTTLLFVRDVRSGDRKSFLVSLMLVACAVGIFRVDLREMKPEGKALEKFLAHTVTLEGVVVREPDIRDTYANIVLKPDRVFYNDIAQTLDTREKILVRIPSYPELRYGDEVSMKGKLVAPKNFSSDDNLREFNYRAYLAKDDIYYQMFFPTVEIVTHNRGNPLLGKLFAFKRILLENINERIPEPEAALGGGILLGTKQSLGDVLLEKFRETGVAHIVVLSGYNIAIVATALAVVFRFLPIGLRVVLGVVGIALFAFMVGGGATVVRATIMVLVVILARAAGRESSALRGLVLAGGVMVLLNPMILLYDVSFQLSFMATLSLAVLVPMIEKYFSWFSNTVLREILVATVATQVFVLPLILYYMGTISLVGIIANIFILPVVPVGMLVVALLSVFGAMPLLGNFFAALSYGVLWYIVSVVELLSRLPFAQVSEIQFPLWGLMLCYTALGFMVIRNYRSIPRTTSSLLR